MSAFICSDLHIATVATFFYATNNKAAQDFANALKRENIKSVNYRYKERTRVTKCNISTLECVGLHGVLNLVQCLEYQSCEHPTYTFAVLDMCKRVLLNMGADETKSNIWSI